MRTGVIAKKMGMTRFFDEAGQHIPVTVLALDGCQVVGQRTKDKDGYVALQLGAGTRKAKRTNNAQRAAYGKMQIEPKHVVAEFRVEEDGLIDVGAELTADHFLAGQKVDVCGITIGKGFAGAIKRWNFGGMRATHGVSVSHRAHGSTGQRQDPGKVFKGKKMAGHLGQERVTTLGVTVWKVDVERGLILIRGSVPGAEGSYVRVRDAIKKAAPGELPMPGAFRKAGEEKAKPAAEEPQAETEIEETPVTAAADEAPAPEAQVEAAAPEAEAAPAAEAPAADASAEDAPKEGGQ